MENLEQQTNQEEVLLQPSSDGKKYILIGGVVAFVVIAGIVFLWMEMTKIGDATRQRDIAQKEFQEFADMSNWQTYRNEEFGFEVKYPPDWEAIDDARDTLVGYIRKQGIVGSEGPAIVIYRNFYGIEASTITKLKEALDAKSLEEVRVRGRDEERFLNRYKSSIKSIGGFDVVLREGAVDDLGYVDPLFDLHVLLEDGEILFFTGLLKEPFVSMFESLKRI